jgi:ribosome-associated protein
MDIEIRGDTIRLGQLLKFAGVASSGDEAKAILAQGGVRVNGKPETRRGRQLHAGDIVHAGGEQIRLLSGS